MKKKSRAKSQPKVKDLSPKKDPVGGRKSGELKTSD
jgi:hypothetical protein